METFLKELLTKIYKASSRNAVSPSTKVRKGEIVVGVLPDDLKRVWAVLCDYCAARKKLVAADKKWLQRLSAKPENQWTPAGKDRVAQHSLRLRETNLIAEIFWFGVQRQFSQVITSHHTVALRKGWRVATSVSTPPLVQILLDADRLTKL